MIKHDPQTVEKWKRKLDEVRRIGLQAYVERQQLAAVLLTEPTEQGNQYVIPGCEKDKTRGPKQMDLF